jgi:hypothetical protein
MIPQIEKEMPSVVEKLQMMDMDRIDELYLTLKRYLQKFDSNKHHVKS